MARVRDRQDLNVGGDDDNDWNIITSSSSSSQLVPTQIDVKPVIPAAPPKRKISQRPSLSCTECSRAKIRCDKAIPCQPCIKKGKTHLCRTQPHISHKEKQAITEAAVTAVVSSTSDPDAVKHAAFAELETFRTTVDLLRSRIAGMEGLLASAFAASNHTTSSSSHSQLASPEFFQLPPLQPDRSNNIPYLPSVASTSLPSIKHITQPPTREGTSSREGSSSNAEALRGEEVEASVALEFMALGRHRTFGATDNPDSDVPHHANDGQTNPPSPTSSQQKATTTTHVPSPTSLYPSPSSLAAAAPRRDQADALISHSLDWLGWHHSAVVAPVFKKEVEEFWSWGDDRIEVANPAWVALWFALLVVGVGNLARGQAPHLGISEDERGEYAKKWFDCAMSSLYRANFLQNHSLFAVQAICVLVVSGQDAASSNIIPTLLSTGISISQDMGLHRMTSDHEWEVSMRGQPHALRVKSLIARETRKRVFWALTSQDWFGIPYRRTYVVQPTQVTTALPANATDEDLLAGYLVNRPPNEYTVVSKLLLWIQIARCLQSVFEHIDKNAAPVYEFVLEVDAHLADVIANCPNWMLDDGPTIGMPPCVDWVRNTFRISSNHKVLTLHRPFLHRAFQDPRYESSRKRAITASRNILREAARCSDNRLWTVPYHIAAGACVVLLDLFQRAGSSSTSLEEERAEVLGALRALEKMQETSSIARRGVALISNLVEEEGRLRDERTRSRNRKRGASDPVSEGREYSQAAKKIALSEISPPASNATTPASDQPSPALSYSNSTSVTNGNYRYSTSLGVPAPSPRGAVADPPLFDFNATGLPPADGALPQEFLSVFLESGFDPLDGAINFSSFASPQPEVLDFGTFDNHYMGSPWASSL